MPALAHRKGAVDEKSSAGGQVIHRAVRLGEQSVASMDFPEVDLGEATAEICVSMPFQPPVTPFDNRKAPRFQFEPVETKIQVAHVPGRAVQGEQAAVEPKHC